MQFLDTVTVFHKSASGYDRKIVDGCYWYGDSSITVQGNGIVRDDSIHIFFPCDVVVCYALEISKNDRIVKGMVPDIKSVNELARYEDKITVTSVNGNYVGSRLDNLLVKGK